MAVEYQQACEDLTAPIQCHLDHILCASSDYTRYSTQNNNKTATFPRSLSTMTIQSIFVSSNHIRIRTTKLLTHIWHLIGSKKETRYVESFDIATYFISNAKDFII